MANIDDVQNPPPTRVLCQTVRETKWYTDAITTQVDFSQCVSLRPELKNVVERVRLFERYIFTKYELVYAELRTLLRYQPPSSRGPHLDVQVSEAGPTWRKFQRLMLYYRLFDRVWLYENPLNLDILVHPNIHQKSSYSGWSHIEDVQKLLTKFRTLCVDKTFTVGKNGDAIQRPVYSARLPAGSGVIQQLKDLVALHETTQLVNIQRNLLFAALGLNWMCQEAENMQSDSSSTQVQSYANSSTPKDASEGPQAVISHAKRSNHLSDTDVEYLRGMFKAHRKDGSLKDDFIHKNLLISLGITPIFLLVPLKLDKSQWSHLSIYKESQELGNRHPDLLVRIEKTILDSVFSIASGSMDAAQALAYIINNLPWKEIDAMSAEA